MVATRLVVKPVDIVPSGVPLGLIYRPETDTRCIFAASTTNGSFHFLLQKRKVASGQHFSTASAVLRRF
jgi:hypothetical protein